MKWRGREKSGNVRRSSGGGRMGGMGGAIGGLGLGGMLILLVFTLLTGGNFGDVINYTLNNPGPSQNMEEYVPRSEEEAEIEEFLSVVLRDTEVIWSQIFEEHGAQYRPATLVLYQDSVNSACGFATSNFGPFYCGGDETIYIDVAFAEDLRTTFNAAGDFPFAYVLAHEVGHHVQLQTGVLQQVQGLKGRVPDTEFNQEMVKMELQADYYAGVFAHYTEERGYLDAGDIDEGLAAASGVGDDRIQEMQGGTANPDTFQHGTSEQRSEWFYRGYQYGDMENGNTFEILN